MDYSYLLIQYWQGTLKQYGKWFLKMCRNLDNGFLNFAKILIKSNVCIHSTNRVVLLTIAFSLIQIKLTKQANLFHNRRTKLKLCKAELYLRIRKKIVTNRTDQRQKQSNQRQGYRYVRSGVGNYFSSGITLSKPHSAEGRTF